MSLGPWQIALIVLVVVLLFGAGKIPRLMGDAAKGINAFKKGLKEGKSEEAANSTSDSALQSDSGDVIADGAKKDEAAKS